MNYLAISGLPMIEEDETTAEIGQIYADVKRDLEVPFVPNFFKALAVSPAALRIAAESFRSLSQHTTLPQSLIAMIHFTIATSKKCEYCSATNELACRTLGIDEETLAALVKDLGNVSPRRVQAIIEFAVKAALYPQLLVAEDYDRVRAQGVTDEELVEILVMAAFGNFGDTLADGLKIKIDAPIAEALGR